MFCWSCGHENSDNHKFCGECGKSLFKPETVVREIATAKSFSRAEDKKASAAQPHSSDQVARPFQPNTPAAPLRPPDGTLLSPPIKSPSGRAISQEAEPPKLSNPLIEESRVTHETPVASSFATGTPPGAPPRMIRDHIPNRITGPSFLGLSDEGTSRGDEGSYLLDDEADSSPWRGYLTLALLVVVSLLVIRNWGDIRSFAAEKFGSPDAAKHATGPERVTASNDASQMTPDAAPEEGKIATPNDADPKSKLASTPQQTAKLDKPENDHASDSASRPETDSSKTDSKEENQPPSPSSNSPKATHNTPAPVYDNSQLEEAQKYLQGRGVQQDCHRGLDLLRAAAKQPNPKARVQMAALYVSGHCVTEDLTQAYDWFSKAQELEPHNRLIERNLDSLWARMSDEERRRVQR